MSGKNSSKCCIKISTTNAKWQNIFLRINLNYSHHHFSLRGCPSHQFSL
jgi:hypothetical protein